MATVEKGPDKRKPNYDIVDPLGEIRNTAKRMWHDAGEAEGTSWEDFFEEAEELLLSGRSGGVK